MRCLEDCNEVAAPLCCMLLPQGLGLRGISSKAAVFMHVHTQPTGVPGMQLDENAGEPLHHTQHDCSRQQGRLLAYQPPPYDQTPCYLNEKTCSRHFAQTHVGTNVTVTFDWKHLMYEDYDRALFEMWKKEGGPHYVFVSPGTPPSLANGDTPVR